MEAPEIKNKDGSITLYGFACGYIERRGWNNDGTESSEITDNCVSLEAANLETSPTLWNVRGRVGGEIFWIQVEGLKHARRAANRVHTIIKYFRRGVIHHHGEGWSSKVVITKESALKSIKIIENEYDFLSKTFGHV